MTVDEQVRDSFENGTLVCRACYLLVIEGMGIHGIYKEIGPGVRIALSKLAIQKFEQTGRPFRLAIDTSIWLFQIQSSKGGTNPALRTFFYRLLRLTSLSIHPLFVFDGPNKPPFKRNKRSGANVASIPEFLAKQLLKQFGFPFHLAPGEAEAECALLQREGIVDAVLSEDVDTLMFGSGITLRNWTPEGKDKTPSHVNVYDAEKTKQGEHGMEREGMVLVALMSGGDYIPEGVPGCGPKTACEAARAGFGKELCSLARNDRHGFRDWRERLQHELTTNEGKHFRTKHKALKLPEGFPNREVLGYYTNPAISGTDKLNALRQSLKWDQAIDFVALREFTADAFKWTQLGGAKHFIRNLAPAMLARELRLRQRPAHIADDDFDAIHEHEAGLISALHGIRNHASTDGIAELRASYIPHRLVPLDLDLEEPDDIFDKDLMDEDEEGDGVPSLEDEADAGVFASTQAVRARVRFDPDQTIRTWIPQTLLEFGTPLMVQDWHASTRAKEDQVQARALKRAAALKRAKQNHAATGGMARGALDKYAVFSKPGVQRPRANIADDLFPSASQPAPVSKPFVNRPAESVTVYSLLSSSPPVPERTDGTATSDILSPNVTVRRTRAGFRRTQTLPADLGSSKASKAVAADMDSLPVMPHLDLTSTKIDSVHHVTPLVARASKRTKFATENEQPSTPSTQRARRGQSVSFSPASTLDGWLRRSCDNTPISKAVLGDEHGRRIALEVPADVPQLSFDKHVNRVEILHDENVDPASLVDDCSDFAITSSRRVYPRESFGKIPERPREKVGCDVTEGGSPRRRGPRVVLAETSGNNTLRKDQMGSRPGRGSVVPQLCLQPCRAVAARRYVEVGRVAKGFWSQRTLVLGEEDDIGRERRGERLWALESVPVVDLTNGS